MSKQKQRKHKKPERLVMDAIYESRRPEVQARYREVMKEENFFAQAVVERGETWFVNEYLDRVHMRMGVAFFHLLSPKNQALFTREYPRAFAVYGNDGSNLAAAV